MSTITTLNTTDNGSTSRTTINTNFTNLNTDKQEKVGGAVAGNVVSFGASNVLQDSGVAANTLVSSTGSVTFTNKNLSDSTTKIINVSDSSKAVQFGLGSMTTSSTLTIAPLQTTSRTLNIPDVGAGDLLVTNNTTATLTNKRITKRVLALSANSATPAINTDLYDVVHITSQTAAITSFTSSLSGTPVDGDTLRISVTGTASVALTFGTSFESSGNITLPTTTSGTTRLDMGFFWNTETSKWRIVALV